MADPINIKKKQERWRDAIKTSLLLKKYSNQALAEFTKTKIENGDIEVRGVVKDGDGKVIETDIVPMTATQVKIANSLLDRTLPQLKQIEFDGSVDLEARLFLVAPDEMSQEEWQKRYGK